MNSADDPKRERASTGGWYSRLTGLLAHFWKFSTRATFAMLVLLLLIPLYSAIFDKSFVIGEFSVPDELQKKGITSAVVGRLFFDRIADMQREAKSAVAEAAESHLGARDFGSIGTTSKVTDIKLPGADISLVSLVSQIRALLHIDDTKIVGEVVMSKGGPDVTYLLRAHATGGDVWVESVEGGDVGALVSTVATRLVERFDPVVAGFYYFRTPEPDKSILDKLIALAHGFQTQEPDKSNLDVAIGFADGFHSTDKRQQAWALVLRGLASREKQKIGRDKEKSSEDTRVSLCAAIELDPSFTPAWRILARSLREDGAFAQAKDLAIRLAVIHPDEPEGYRQLGTSQGDCMAGEEQAQQAKWDFERAIYLKTPTFFESAIERGKKAIALGAERESDYLSRVDYARFLYEQYKPPHWRPDASAPARSDMDDAGDYLKKAYDIPPDEPALHTIWARALAHPRTSDESRGARESRLLEAELKARYALTRDSTSAFANFVMGELLTERGVEQHEYKHVDSFIRAKDFLDNSRRGAVHPEFLEAPMYARALAGAGDYRAAENILTDLEKKGPPNSPNSPNYLAEWVHGEMLYNRGMYEEALAHLRAAESVRTCGPRSNVVRDLITRIEKKANQPSANGKQVASNDTKQVQASIVTGLSAAKGEPPKNLVEPLPKTGPACPSWKELVGDELSPTPLQKAGSFLDAG
jgi:tetratricopeptide (TPR) repeat protein